MFRKYVPLVLTLGVTLGALVWMAAANLIDSTLMVDGRVADSDGQPLANVAVLGKSATEHAETKRTRPVAF